MRLRLLVLCPPLWAVAAIRDYLGAASLWFDWVGEETCEYVRAIEREWSDS